MGRPRTGFAYLDDPDGVIAFAHRGGSLHPEIPGLENTLAAFEHAVALGYTYLETDVHATRDGTLVAFHDASLDRTTGLTGLIHELGYEALTEARIAGAHAIPRLDDLLDVFPQARFNIDIKSAPAIVPLAELVRRRGAQDRICVGAFSERSVREFRRRTDGRVATSCGLSSVLATRFAPPGTATVTAALLHDRGGALQVPPRHRGVTVITASFVRRAHQMRRHVHAWTIDDPVEMHRLLDLGVDGIFSDRTDLLREVLLERGVWGGSPA